MKFTESLGQHLQRIKKEGARKPLRTITELAETLGVKKMELVKTLANNGGPKPVMCNGGKSNRQNTWYDPTEVIRFIEQFKASPTLHCASCGLDRPKADFYKLTYRRPCKECASIKRPSRALK